MNIFTDTLIFNSIKLIRKSQVGFDNLPCNSEVHIANLQASTDSLNSAENFRPVEINLGEVKTVLKMYKKHKISVTSIMSEGKKM